MNDVSEYTLLDKFSLHQGKIACDLFEEKRIDFQIEMADSPHQDIKPWQSLWGGSFGTEETSVNIYVLKSSLEQCITILNEHKNKPNKDQKGGRACFKEAPLEPAKVPVF
ncbi:hypothetical protein [Pontiella desulfatans]|uniref:hypothetical protein n=1 Tax=Pontiella desulfatans TaxID=2750659 RepID=UPI00109CCE1C|nr:hypothetical protein [Pontiella desulfatans]